MTQVGLLLPFAQTLQHGVALGLPVPWIQGGLAVVADGVEPTAPGLDQQFVCRDALLFQLGDQSVLFRLGACARRLAYSGSQRQLRERNRSRLQIRNPGMPRVYAVE